MRVALFFDADWFDARLAAAGLTRAIAAQALGITGEQLAEVWKDQRELSARDVATLSALLGVTAEDVARHAGISTPVPRTASIEERLAKVERELAELKALIGK
jgi:transcriptional regulator with XRE-family HTH domain